MWCNVLYLETKNYVIWLDINISKFHIDLISILMITKEVYKNTDKKMCSTWISILFYFILFYFILFYFIFKK